MSNSKKSVIASMRLPSGEMRKALADKCKSEGTTASAFMRDSIIAYVEGRLFIIEKPEQSQ